MKDRLWRVEEVSTRSRDYGEVAKLKSELNALYDKEEQMWKQRSRIWWLKHGDQNTTFFHGSTTQRKRRNFIRRLWDENGVWQEDEKVVLALLNNFYTQLFSSSDP